MPFDGQAQWQIDILAADKTAAAFASVQRRMKAIDTGLASVTTQLNQQQGVYAALAARQTSFAAGMGLITRLAGPLAPALTAAGSAARGLQVAIEATRLPDQAMQLDTTTNALQGFRAVALQSGVDAGTFDAALQRLIGTLGEAKNGNEQAIEWFEKLGVKVLDADGRLRGVNDVLPDVARGLLKLGSTTEQVAVLQERLGKQGGRLVTMLPQLAQGTDVVTEAARRQGLMIEKSMIDPMKRAMDQLQVVGKQWDVFLAKVTIDFAVPALDYIVKRLEATRKEIEGIVGFVERFTGNQSIDKQVAGVNNDIAAFRERGYDDDNPVMQDLFAKRKILEAMAADQAYTVPEQTIKGVANPTARGGAGAGAGGGSKSIKDATDEIGALLKKMEEEGAAVTDRFGNGMAFARRETADLAAMLAISAIDADTHARALQDITKRADDMARAYRGATGGWDGFAAGLEQGLADMERANSAFELGKQSIDLLADGITDLATGAEVDFNRILQSFLGMIIQMELRAAASNVWGALGGSSGILGLLGLGGQSGGYSTLSPGATMSAYNAMPAAFTLPGFADGGRPSIGMPSIVGERGPELFVPDRAGTIVPNHGLGGGGSVTVNQTMYFGSDVDRSTLRAWGEQVKQQTIAAVLDDRRRGGKMKRAFG